MNSFQKQGLKLFIQVSTYMVIPIMIALFFGRFLDKKFDTKPFIFLGLSLIAFCISLYNIYKKLGDYIRELEIKEEKEKLEKQYQIEE